MRARDAWRETLAGACFLVGGIVRHDTLALVLAFLLCLSVARVQDEGGVS